MYTHARLAAAASLLVLVAGCGGDDDKQAAAPTTPKAESRPFPMTPETALKSGVTYIAEGFAPKATLTFPTDSSWSTGKPTEDSLDSHLQATSPVRWSSFGVQHIKQVFDPQKGGRTAADAVDAPADFAAWLRAHQRLEATAPVQVQVGGLKGVQVDVTTKSFPRRVPDECLDQDLPCVPLFVQGGEPIVYPEGSKSRFYVLESDAGQVVVESFVDPASEFAKLAGTHEQVLRSLKFEG
jgi:hypothetical protein